MRLYEGRMTVESVIRLFCFKAMPYTVGSAPSYVKKKSPKAQRAWVKTFNSAYTRCVLEKRKKNGNQALAANQKKACETRAFKIANAIARRLENSEGGTMSGFFYIELASLALGKAFDAVVSGNFVDMLGRKVTFKKADLQTYVKNTMEAIEATTTESGEVVGLPIDARGHDKGDGAGWIVEAKFEDGKVRVVPKWTEVGQELIQKGIRRFFSPTVDTENKVILGGTLTNWPATRDKKGKILLRPIELEQEDFLIIDEDQEFEEEVIPDDEENIELAESLNPKQTWIEAAIEQFENATDYLRRAFQGDDVAEDSEDPKSEVLEMELTQEQLKALIGDTIAEMMTPEANPDADPEGDQDDKPRFDLIRLFEMEGASEEFRAAVKEQMLSYFNEQRSLMLEDAAKEIAQVKRESAVSEFSARITGGTEETPHGIATDPDELKKFILGLDPDQARYFQTLLEKIVAGDGVIDFEEKGNGKKPVGTMPLPAFVSRKLDDKELELSDLDDPLLGLGDISQYDLSKWQK